MRELISYIIGGPLLTLMAFLVVGAGLAHGLFFGNQLTGRKTKIVLYPKKEHWQDDALFFIPFFALWYPIFDLIVFRDLRQGSMGLPLSLAVLGGLIVGMSGVTTIGWKCLSFAVVVIVPANWYLLFFKPVPVELSLAVAYLFAGTIVGWNCTRAVIRTMSAQDEIVEDPAGAGASEKTVSGLGLLRQDGQLVNNHPGFSVRNRAVGFIRHSISFTALVRPEGLYLRIAAVWEDTPRFAIQFNNPKPRKAVWVLLPRNHLKIIAHDKIIGHREIRLRLKNSGEELVLDSPPRDIERYLTE